MRLADFRVAARQAEVVNAASTHSQLDDAEALPHQIDASVRAEQLRKLVEGDAVDLNIEVLRCEPEQVVAHRAARD